MLPAKLKPADLPTPPKVAMDVIRACAEDGCSNARLGKLAERDPRLTAETLRVVNSAWYGFRQEVKSVAHAAVILGQRALRNLVLCIAVRDTVSGVQIEGLDAEVFAVDALRRAVAAQLLSASAAVDANEAFTVGLLQDFGLLVLYFLAPGVDTPWCELREHRPDQRRQLEIELFGDAHDLVGGRVAEQWQLPEELRLAIAGHHSLEGQDSGAMARVAGCADWLAAVFECGDKAGCAARCRDVLADYLSLSASQVDDYLERLPPALEEAARDLGIRADNQTPFSDLMLQANATLAEENLSYQELTLRLQNTLSERDRLAAELDRELESAREIQRALLPGEIAPPFPVYGLNVSARQLSGDFYDYFALPDGRLYLVLGDVAGKGANAAIVMSKVASLGRCLARRGASLPDIVGTLNEEIVDTSTHGIFVTLACGLADPERGLLEFVNAGHLPALVMRDGEKPRLLRASGPPLGVLNGAEYTMEIVKVSAARVYLFSDGVTECRLDNGAELEILGLLKLLQQSWSLAPAPQLRLITKKLVALNDDVRDDLTLLRLSLDGSADV